MHIRAVLPLIALLAIPLLTALGSHPDDPVDPVDPLAPPPETLAALVAQGQGPDAAATCGMCHTEIYAEWKGRKHARAWVDPIYQAAIEKKTRPQLCHRCHIPAPVLDRLGRAPRIRDRHLEEGVTCVACHKKGDTMHGPYGSDTLAHFCEKDPAFSFAGSVSLCASCHATQIEDVLPVAKSIQINNRKPG